MLNSGEPGSGDIVMECVNPQCSRASRDRYAGRIFRLRLWPVGTYGVPDYRVRYFWLCAACSSAFTLIFDQRRGVSLAPLNDAGHGCTNTHLIFDIAAAYNDNRDRGRIGIKHEPGVGTELNNVEEEAHRGRKRTVTRKTRSRR